MAVPLLNPQDPTFRHESMYPIKKKPSRTVLYIRNRTSCSSLSMICVGAILTILSTHRIFSLYMTHRRWINAPITYMHRTCPGTGYEVISDPEEAGTICITTLTDSKSTSHLQRFLRWRNFDGILELTWKNKANYADKHGYLLFDGSPHMDTSRPPAWSKIPAMMYLLQEDSPCDWVLWSDADTVIMNSDIKLTEFLPSEPTKDLLVASDNGGGYNSGVFLFRKSEWSRKFLDQWWNMKSFVRPPGMSLSGDNAAMKALLRDMEDFDDHVVVPPRCTFNSFAKFLTYSESSSVMERLDEQDWYLSEDYYHKGDFLAHTPGYDNKAECLRLLLNEAI